MYGFIVLSVYTISMIGITFAMSKRSNTAESFHVADRKLGLVQSAMSIAATWIWAPALFTSAEKAYSNGIPGLFWFLVPNIICLLVFVPFGKRIRRQMPDGVTLSGYMAQRTVPRRYTAHTSSSCRLCPFYRLGCSCLPAPESLQL